MANDTLSNADKFKKLTFENKTKLVTALEQMTGRKKLTIKQHWLWNDAVPDEYRSLVTKGLDKIYKSQLKNQQSTKDKNLKKLEKLIS